MSANAAPQAQTTETASVPNINEATAAFNVTASKKAKAPKAKAPKAPKAEEQKPTEQKAEESPRAVLLAKVNAAIADAQKDSEGKPRHPSESRAILTKAMGEVVASCPNVVFSENKEQRHAEMEALRAKRAELGWQQCARLLGDAIAAIPGATEERKFSAQPLSNGSLVAREVITRRSKAPKRAGARSVVIR